MKLKLFICYTFFGCAIFSSCSTKKLHNHSVVKVNLQLDTTELMQQTGSITPDLVIQLNNGKAKTTKGFSFWSWNRFKVSVENGSFKNGKIIYNPTNIIKNNKTITLIIQPKNNANYTDTFKIEVPKPIAIKAFASPNSRLIPNFPIKIDLEIKYTNGKTLTSWENDSLWNLFALEQEGRPLINNFIWVKDRAPRIIDSVHIKVTYKRDKSVSSKAYIPITYKKNYHFTFNGGNGFNAFNGNDGQRAYKCTENNRFSGRGNSGQTGEAGENGKDVSIYCDFVEKENHYYLRAKIVSGTAKQWVIVNVKGGRLKITTNGGNGGSGGDGGDGADGRDATTRRDASFGGSAGNGGRGGAGGNGGTVTIYATQKAKAFLNIISVENNGGLGGKGGERGRRGKGGFDENEPFLIKLLGLNNGLRGTNGSNGNIGVNGPLKKVVVLSNEEIKRIINSY